MFDRVCSVYFMEDQFEYPKSLLGTFVSSGVLCTPHLTAFTVGTKMLIKERMNFGQLDNIDSRSRICITENVLTIILQENNTLPFPHTLVRMHARTHMTHT